MSGLPFSQRVLDWALLQVGRPYCWGGCGSVTWTPKGLVPTIKATEGASVAFDCAGLVKAAVFACGGADVRATHNAQTMYDKLPPPAETERFVLRMYGTKTRITHVAFELGNTGLVLEAAGGDHTTKTLADSLNRPNAFVRVNRDTRTDCVAYRSLAALEGKK